MTTLPVEPCVYAVSYIFQMYLLPWPSSREWYHDPMPRDHFAPVRNEPIHGNKLLIHSRYESACVCVRRYFFSRLFRGYFFLGQYLQFFMIFAFFFHLVYFYFSFRCLVEILFFLVSSSFFIVVCAFFLFQFHTHQFRFFTLETSNNNSHEK